jgi:hypothetical protein
VKFASDADSLSTTSAPNDLALEEHRSAHGGARGPEPRRRPRGRRAGSPRWRWPARLGTETGSSKISPRPVKNALPAAHSPGSSLRSWMLGRNPTESCTRSWPLGLSLEVRACRPSASTRSIAHRTIWWEIPGDVQLRGQGTHDLKELCVLLEAFGGPLWVAPGQDGPVTLRQYV